MTAKMEVVKARMMMAEETGTRAGTDAPGRVRWGGGQGRRARQGHGLGIARARGPSGLVNAAAVVPRFTDITAVSNSDGFMFLISSRLRDSSAPSRR
jgi:hypothetical protein